MNRTEAVKAHKLSASMVTAIESMTYKAYDANREGHTGYSTTADIHPRTRKALHDRGIMHGHYYLTREGVNILAALTGNKVDAPSVEIQDMPSEPEFDAPGAAECFFGCGRDVVAVFVDYVGRTEGVCAAHRERIEGQTYELPTVATVEPHTDAGFVTATVTDPINGRVIIENGEFPADWDDAMIKTAVAIDHTGNGKNGFAYVVTRETDAESVSYAAPVIADGDGITSVMTVAVIQNTSGMAGVTHYHAPGCRDIQREMRKYGQRPSDAFENGFGSVAEILEFEFGDIASDNADSHTPEWWSEIFYNATGDAHGGVKIMPCLDIPNGETSDGSPIIRDGHFYRAGFKRSQESQDAARKAIAEHNVNTCDERECITCWAKFTSECQENHTGKTECKACESVSIEYDESARKFPCVMVGGIIIHKGECAQAHGVNGPVCSLEGDDETEDAGFVETECTGYADTCSVPLCASCSTQVLTAHVSRNATSEANVTTGTTHHTMDTDGNEWTRFEHVLSVGDVVKAVGTPGLFTVHALIPGLPVVYLDAHDGREPFPMGASKVYAL